MPTQPGQGLKLMEMPSFRNQQIESQEQVGLLHESKVVSDDQKREMALKKKIAHRKKVFHQTALTAGASIGAVFGAAIGFFVPYVIILLLSSFGGDPSRSFALVIGVVCGVAGLFMGAAAGYITAQISSSHFLKHEES